MGEISDVTKLAGFEFTEYVIYSDEGKIIALRGLNIKNGKLNLNDVKYIDKSDFSKLGRSKLIKSDILLTYVGTVGELAVIAEDNKYYFAPNVSRIRLKDKYNSIFCAQQMRRKAFYDEMIFPLIATSSQPALSMENVRKFKISLPQLEEQTQIGTFFKTLDNLITLHQKQCVYLYKLRSENSREKINITDTWEQRELNEFSNYVASPIIADEKIDNGKYKLYDANSCIGFIDYGFQKEDYITIIKDGAGVGRVRQLPKNTAFIGTMGGITSKGSDLNFLFNILEKTDFKADISGGTIPHIYYSQYGKNTYKIPLLQEQTQIGTFFKTLDNLITLHQCKPKYIIEMEEL